MKCMPKKGFTHNDVVYTPPELAIAFVKHFNPIGKGLDPCRGAGAFFNAFNGEKEWCEISEGRDFYDYTEKVDYIMTNPPWGDMRHFLQHAYEISNDVYYLTTAAHCFTRARLRDMREAGFGIVEICGCDTPKKDFPSSGLLLAMTHWKRGYTGDIKLTYLNDKKGESK